jgi:hypothetical protein
MGLSIEDLGVTCCGIAYLPPLHMFFLMEKCATHENTRRNVCSFLASNPTVVRMNAPKHNYYPCVICGSRAWLDRKAPEESYQTFHCLRCNEFKADPTLTSQKLSLTQLQIANISGYVRANSGTIWNSETIPELLKLRTPTVAEKAMKLLVYFQSLHPLPGRAFESRLPMLGNALSSKTVLPDGNFPEDGMTDTCRDSLPLLSASSAQDAAEVGFLISEFLVGRGYLMAEKNNSFLSITPAGWEWLETRPETASKQCFVAMWFADEMKNIYLGPLSEGIRNAGYEPFRVDHKEHNNDITDEILAEIRRSKFVLADFTGHRGGVYYEAGFAAGLGKPVVRTVRLDHADDIHFDTRQISHIRWRQDNLPAFAKAITNRIVATIGQGPVLSL